MYRWLLLAKLQQQSGNAEGFTSAQNQALELQRTLLEQLRQSGGAAAGSSSSSASKGRASHAAADLLSGLGGGMAAAVGNIASAKAKAASICFDLAEYYRKHRQFDKAEEAYQACLTHQDKHGAAHLALARLALASGQVHGVKCLVKCNHSQQQQKRQAMVPQPRQCCEYAWQGL
jgi:tetratricopeptide (TPR) repeat protein